MEAVGFRSLCLNGPLPYVQLHISVNKMFGMSLNKTLPSFLVVSELTVGEFDKPFPA